ncbi:MAG TPA: GNAT family N-acetyltransferase [Ktedonobacteraceae bacterium]
MEAKAIDIFLRAATHEDYEALCALFAQGDRVHYQALPEFFRPVEGPARSQEFFAEILANEDVALFVVEHEGALVGVIRCNVMNIPEVPVVVPRRFVLIQDIVVDESFRQQGIGQALIERVHRWAREKGVTEIELGVWEFNAAARSLYEKLGYRTTRRVMRKQLQ